MRPKISALGVPVNIVCHSRSVRLSRYLSRQNLLWERDRVNVSAFCLGHETAYLEDGEMLSVDFSALFISPWSEFWLSYVEQLTSGLKVFLCAAFYNKLWTKKLSAFKFSLKNQQLS